MYASTHTGLCTKVCCCQCEPPDDLGTLKCTPQAPQATLLSARRVTLQAHWADPCSELLQPAHSRSCLGLRPQQQEHSATLASSGSLCARARPCERDVTGQGAPYIRARCLKRFRLPMDGSAERSFSVAGTNFIRGPLRVLECVSQQIISGFQETCILSLSAIGTALQPLMPIHGKHYCNSSWDKSTTLQAPRLLKESASPRSEASGWVSSY